MRCRGRGRENEIKNSEGGGEGDMVTSIRGFLTASPCPSSAGRFGAEEREEGGGGEREERGRREGGGGRGRREGEGQGRGREEEERRVVANE